MLNILWRNIKWRFNTPISIIITIIQPIIWLVLYGPVADQTMKNMGVGNYTAFILPGIIVLVTFSACSSGGIINYIMKNRGSYYRVVISPVSRRSIVLGQVLEAVLTSFIEVTILLIISLIFSVKIAAGIREIFFIALFIFLTAFFMSSAAYSISLFLPNEVIYETMMNAIVLPIFFLSSALFPTENLSGGLAIAVNLNPFTHIINTLRSLMLGETLTFLDILPVILLFVVMSYGSFTMGIWSLKKETSY